MTTLENRPNTALVVIDVQNGNVNGNLNRDAVVANVGALVDKARREEVPVVWVQHNDENLTRGSEEWQIVPELAPSSPEPLIEKSYGDSFEDTNLESRPVGPRSGPAPRRGGADGRVHPLDAPRRARPGIRRDARQ